jgi:hypothetical protein
MGEATQIASAMAANGHLVVSCRNGSGNLELITLDVPDEGPITVEDTSGKQAREIKPNALIARPNGVLSAVKAGSDALKLINWQVDATRSSPGLAIARTRLVRSAPSCSGPPVSRTRHWSRRSAAATRTWRSLRGTTTHCTGALAGVHSAGSGP